MTDEHRTVHKRKRQNLEGSVEDSISNRKDDVAPQKEKKHKRSKHEVNAEKLTDRDGQGPHSGIRKKFQKSASITQKVKEIKKLHGEDEVPVEEQPKELQNLGPLPQPIRIEDVNTPIAKALPDWLSRPIKASASEETPIEEFALEENLQANLKTVGIEKAFAIQSKVLPLLLPGSNHHNGDICVSAATGSGKTLSYTLPMIQALSGRANTRLRGVVVVPTRELVNQVRDVFLQCTPRSGLQVGIAVGNKTLKQEKKALIRKEFKYDPEVALRPIDERQRKIESHMGWDSDASDDEDGPPPFGHVKDYQSAVDILICTPGRLVDHVRSTNGFTLDYVEWLVIDEADRLLDSSFQQWVDVIVPALERLQPKPIDIVNLQKYFLIRPQRNVQKVILSATMTENISKLIKLRLRNPVLVALEGLSPTIANEADMTTGLDLRMPEKLQEVAVAVGKADEKPLVLIKALRHYASRAMKQPRTQDGQGNKNDHFDSEDDTLSDDDPDDNFDEYASEDSSGANHGTSSEQGSDSEDEISDSSDSSISDHNSVPEAVKRPSSERNGAERKVNGIKKPLQGVLVFTNTNESALRLTRLIALVAPELAESVQSTTKSTAAYGGSKALRAFKTGKISILVATDRASRGLDIQNLACVINYDIPTSLANYVHRTGRTARAGNEGLAVTLVSHHEGRWFWSEIGRSEKVKRHDKIQRQDRLQDEVTEDDRQALEAALTTLQAEATGRPSKARYVT